MLATRESFEVPQEIWCTGFVLDSVAEALKLLDLLVVALFRARSSGVLRKTLSGPGQFSSRDCLSLGQSKMLRVEHFQ